jgi:WD40 repeat protein
MRDAASLRPLATWPAGGRFAWSPNGQWIAFDPNGNGQLRLWNVVGQKPGPQLVPDNAAGNPRAAWSPDSTLLAFPGKGKVRLFRIPSGERLPDLKVDVEQVSHVAWSPDGRLIAAAGMDGTIRLVQMPERKAASVLKIKGNRRPNVEGQLPLLEWSRSGHLAYGEQDAIEAWNATGDQSQFVPCYAGVIALAWSPQGKHIAAIKPGQLSLAPELFDVATGQPIPGCKPIDGNGLNAIAWSPDGRYLAGQPAYGATVTLWDMSTREAAQVNILFPGGKAATFSAAGKLLSTNVDLEQELVYIIQEDGGQRRLLKPAEFRAMIAKNPPRAEKRTGRH